MGMQDRNAGVFQKGWEMLIGAVAFVFKNQGKNQLATKIPVEGKFSDPKPDIFSAVWVVLQNAFVQAPTSSIDSEINMSSIKVDKANIDNPKLLKTDSDGKKKKQDKSK